MILSLGYIIYFLPVSLLLEILTTGWRCVGLWHHIRGFVRVFWNFHFPRCLLFQWSGVCQDPLGLVGGGRGFFSLWNIVGKSLLWFWEAGLSILLMLPWFDPLGWVKSHPVILCQRSTWIELFFSCLDGVLGIWYRCLLMSCFFGQDPLRLGEGKVFMPCRIWWGRVCCGFGSRALTSFVVAWFWPLCIGTEPSSSVFQRLDWIELLFYYLVGVLVGYCPVDPHQGVMFWCYGP